VAGAAEAETARIAVRAAMENFILMVFGRVVLVLVAGEASV